MENVGPRRGGSEIWQDQAQHGQCHDDIKIGVDALQIVILLADDVSRPVAGQANEPVESNHDHGKNHVPPKCGTIFP